MNPTDDGKPRQLHEPTWAACTYLHYEAVWRVQVLPSAFSGLFLDSALRAYNVGIPEMQPEGPFCSAMEAVTKRVCELVQPCALHIVRGAGQVHGRGDLLVVIDAVCYA